MTYHSQLEYIKNTTSHLKKRILVQYQGGISFQTGVILQYFEDLKEAPNTDSGPKDFFEMACSKFSGKPELKYLDKGERKRENHCYRKKGHRS